MLTTRRLTLLAIAAASVAVVSVIVAAQGGGESGDSSDDAWILGLLLIAAPLIAAGATHSVAASRLLRPVGGGATALCALASLVHVAIAVDLRGGPGWLYGLPAIVTPLLLAAAVVRGPDRRREVETPAVTDSPRLVRELTERTPLDVVTPLRRARQHTAKVAAAWVVVLLAAPLVCLPAFRLLGWPTIDTRVDARVVEVRTIGRLTAVTFEGRQHERPVRWTYTVEGNRWEVGDSNVAYLDDEGRLHEDQQFGLAGAPLLAPIVFVGGFGALSVRRLWGLAIAWWDVRSGDDAPRLGYAAVIDDPAPRTWRPLLAVWQHDPTRGERLARPDAVYRADEDTAAHLETPASTVVVRRAWIDTGAWARSKPRWIGLEDGVAVPHRRAFLGRWYVHLVTKKSDARAVVGLDHGPPRADGGGGQGGAKSQRCPHAVMPMILWRLAVVALGIGVALLEVDHGIALAAL